MNPHLYELIDEMNATGQNAEILPMLARYIKMAPDDAEAWFTLSKYIPEPERKLDCLDRALRLDPNLEEARSARQALNEPQDAPDAPEQAAVPAENNPAPPVGNPSDLPVMEAGPAETVIPTAEFSTHPVKKAGESTAAIARYYRGMTKLDKVFVVFVSLISIILVFLFLKGSSHLLTFAIGYLSVLLVSKVLLQAVKKKRTDEKKSFSFSKGAQGEQIIGEILESLGADYRIWHDVPSKHGNIDHVMLNKKGQMFMIETKANSGRVKVKDSKLLINDHPPEKDMIGQCLCNLYDLRETIQDLTGINIWVSAFLVFTRAFVESGKPISNIRVINKKYLKRAIEAISREGQGRVELWNNAGVLDKAFSVQNTTYQEFQRKDFQRLSGWGED